MILNSLWVIFILNSGSKSLFSQQLTTYPDRKFYTMLFSTALPVPTTYYDVVISINTIHFL
jgi:hypothetical protein